MKILRKIITLILKEYYEDSSAEKDVIGEPDLTNSEQRKSTVKKKKNKNKSEMSAGGVAGVATPVGTGPTYPAKIKKKSKKRK